MSGIAGWIGGALPLSAETLSAMGTALGGETVQASGAEWGAVAACPFGRVSLHRDEDLVVVVQGRLRFASGESAALARERSPAAAIAALWRAHGKEALTALRGPFALAILAPARKAALLAIDRMGVGRLCFARTRGGLVFASRLPALLSHPEVEDRLSPQGLYDYLHAHMVPAPTTIYAGVQKLLPAQWLSCDGGRTNRGFYWRAHWEDGESGDFGERRQAFRTLIERAVARTIDDAATGSFLSGGTDSSTVTGLLAKLRGDPVDSFSIGFAAEGYDEIAYARIAARHFGTRAHEYYVTPADVASAVPSIARHYDEPFGNASAVPTYYCALEARAAGMAVLLAGDGGDEIFGGNARYAKQKIFGVYRRIPAFIRHGLLEPLAGTPTAQRLPLVRKFASYVAQARLPLPDRLESYNFLEREKPANVFTPEFLQAVDPEEPLAIQRRIWAETPSGNDVNRMLALDWKQTLADNDLRKVSEMTEAAGVEVRYPMLDEDLVAFATALPPSYKVRGTKLRWFFKEALQDFLPKEILTKSKHGFGLPFGIWMASDPALHALAHEALTRFRRRGILREDYVDRLLDAHRQHAGYYGVMIWVVMMLEQWLDAHGHSA